MNRLILIGNGFDLAHNIKTSYRSFILDYLKNVFNEARNNSSYEDQLVNVRVNGSYSENANHGLDINSWDLSNFLKYIDAPFVYINDDFMQRIKTYRYEFIFDINSELIKILITKCDEYNWVDVENEYYLLLCKLSSEDKQKEIEQLNKEFDYLQVLLQKYLKKVEDKYVNEDSENYIKSYLVDQLTEIINTSEVAVRTLGKNHPDFQIKNILILNFNYTNTIQEYLEEIRKKVANTTVINIHGKLDDESNPIIFGYGDEEETNYATLEKYDECLRFVKTYRYSRTHNYQNFIDFIESDDFEVYVLGHSCGLSDKTLLSEIFNNKKCIKLKLLTYNKKPAESLRIDSTDYIEKTYQIGRVFKEKSEMRRKLIPFNPNHLIRIRHR
ncbi:AbiH family protein [Chryseobacterium sp.]|uniref:AbiH family protein n=1 Tax=Chryseobacterium sp. TaxID=1871047 RepID=UPI00289FFE96|nr:AbiH family protein [Chryseobacterium sp.]